MSTSHALVLTIGCRFRYDGRTWTVTAMYEGSSLQARSTLGQVAVLSVQHLVSDPSFASLVAEGDEVPATTISVLGLLTPQELKKVEQRAEAVLEVLTGYRGGDAELALANEPRPEYAPEVSLQQKMESKADELGCHWRTIENWIKAYRLDAVEGLVDGKKILPRTDHFEVWREVAAQLLAGRTGLTRVGKNIVMPQIDKLVSDKWPEAKIPGKTMQYQILGELDVNKQYFTGSTKGQKNRAAVPNRPYGYKEANRPGQFVILDTTPLDVFAMNHLNGKWERCQLTLAMDWCTRCVVGLSLTPYSTKAKDVASVLYQVVMPRPRIMGERWPYVGIPENVVVDVAKTEFEGRPLGPALVPEGVVIDHGKQYISHHVLTACHHFGIHVQPARKARGSDKGLLERYFRTIREGLLQHLTGYMGPDIASRGDDVEKGAFYFIDELEGILRDWIEDHYHQRPHSGLQLDAAPGKDLSPAKMYEARVGLTGPITVPARPDLAIDFLPVVYRKVNHYGVQPFAGLKYNGDVLKPYRNKKSRLGGSTKRGGKWPIAFDPDDIRVVFFQDDTGHWHSLKWNKADVVGGPFSLDMLRATKELLDPSVDWREPTSVDQIIARMPLASAKTTAARRALVRTAVMNRDKLTNHARTFADGSAPAVIGYAEEITRNAAVDVVEMDHDNWADLLESSSSSTFERA